MLEEELKNLSAEEGPDYLPAGDLGGFDFDPTEDELVLHFLRPQLRGLPPRVAGAVLEADPCAAAPWELLARYGLREQGHFFAARARGRGRGSVRRAVAGAGAWMHSSTRAGRSVTDFGVVVRWSRVSFCFYAQGRGAGPGQRSTGWVMEEYEITDPRCYRRCDEEGEEDDYWVLCRVRKSRRSSPPPAKNKRRWRRVDDLQPDSAKISSQPLRA